MTLSKTFDLNKAFIECVMEQDKVRAEAQERERNRKRKPIYYVVSDDFDNIYLTLYKKEIASFDDYYQAETFCEAYEGDEDSIYIFKVYQKIEVKAEDKTNEEIAERVERAVKNKDNLPKIPFKGTSDN